MTFQKIRERVIEFTMLLCALFSVAITGGIVWVLVYESWHFFETCIDHRFSHRYAMDGFVREPALWHHAVGHRNPRDLGRRSAGGVTAGNHHCHLFK